MAIERLGSMDMVSNSKNGKFGHQSFSRRSFIGKSIHTTGGISLGFQFLVGCTTTRSFDFVKDGKLKTLYLEVGKNNEFILTFDKAEMGQGIITGQATLFGEEADIEPTQFQMVPASANARYATVGGQMITGGSTSTVDRWDVLRIAGAKYRNAVLQAASLQLKVEKSLLTTDNGYVLNRKDGSRHPYSKFNDSISDTMFSEEPNLKPKEEFKYIGKYSKSVDAYEKSSGKANFGIDRAIPSSLIAIVIRPPVFGGKLRSFEKKKIEALPEVDSCFEISTGVAIVCKKYYQTLAVRKKIKETDFTWDIDQGLKVNSKDLFASFRDELPENLEVSDNQKLVEGVYELPYLSHAPLEPQNCSAFFDGTQLKVIAPTQMPTIAKAMGANICNISQDQVFVENTKYLGGGFGRNTFPSTRDAIEITQKLKKPVQVIWSREDDMHFSALRPMSVTKMQAVTEAKKIKNWNYHTVQQSIIQEALSNEFTNIFPEWMQSGIAEGLGSTLSGTLNLFGIMPMAEEGAKQPYELPYDVSATKVELQVPVFFWRSVGNSINGFVVESFLDEVIHSLNEDPYEFRKKLLKEDDRATNVLNLVAEKSGFKNRQSETGRGKGLSYHYSFKTHCAQVADVTVSPNGELKVHKIWAAVDCGQIVNPHIVEAQVRSSIIYGLSAALKGKIEFSEGRIEQSNYDSYPPLYLNEVPEVEVILAQNSHRPTGIGEPGLPPAASAVGNAIFAASGKRLRKLPFDLASSVKPVTH